MANVVSWGDREKNNKKGRSGNDFLRLKPGEYQIRCIGRPVKFYRYYVDQPAGSERPFLSAITSDPEECVIRNVYNQEPACRYALNVINRESGELQILEMPQTIFNQIADWAEEWEVAPGGPEGCDFKIKVQREGNNPRNTKYKVIPLKQTPFSDEEAEYLKDDGKGLHALLDIFRATPQDKIEEALGLKAPSGDGGGSAEASQTVSAGSGKDASDDDFPF